MILVKAEVKKPKFNSRYQGLYKILQNLGYLVDITKDSKLVNGY